MQHAFGTLDQDFQFDPAWRQIFAALDLRQQPVGKLYVGCCMDLGKDHHINVGARGFDYFDHVAVKEFCVDAVSAESTNLALEIQSLEGLYNCLACCFLL